MPLKFIRTKVAIAGPLQAAVATTALTKNLLSTLQFPPATAACTILLVILETIQSIQVNRQGCDSLARRAAKILIDINEQMQGRWEDAPKLLVQNLRRFEETLNSIQQFMRRLADLKWSDRFLRKSAIEDALAEYATMLDEAARSFQIATLIDIQYAVSSLRPAANVALQKNENLMVVAEPSVPPPYDSPTCTNACSDDVIPLETPAVSEASTAKLVTDLSTSHDASEDSKLRDHYLPEELCSLDLDDRGFRRYHQSDIVLRGRSRLKEGWWADAMEVQVRDQPALIKRYDGKNKQGYKQWIRDVKLLQNLYHPNLPQMLGFSEEESLTPFVLLSNVQTQTPQALVRDVLRSANLATCAELMLRFYRDLSDTAIYVQRQLNLDDSKLQDFFESATFRVDHYKALVVGLPPPREGTWYSSRNYGLAHSLLNACLAMLPNNGRVTYHYDRGDEEVTDEMQKKINHLVTLARSLLPRDRDPPALSSKLQALIEDSDYNTPSLTLRQVRDLSFAANGHDHTWFERSVPAHKFNVGDVGYIPHGKDFNSFVHLRNIIQGGMSSLTTSSSASGQQWCWEQVPMRRELIEHYDLPGNVAGWPVAVPPHEQIDVAVIHEAVVSSVKDAWRFLLQNGKTLAEEGKILPEELILVTRAGTHQDFYVKDFRFKHFGVHQRGFHPHQANPFHHQQMHGFQQPSYAFGSRQLHMPTNPMIPAIFYLFTSLDSSHEPYWSPSPVCVPKDAPRPSLGGNHTYKIGWNTGFLHYVQLHAEDFTD